MANNLAVEDEIKEQPLPVEDSPALQPEPAPEVTVDDGIDKLKAELAQAKEERKRLEAEAKAARETAEAERRSAFEAQRLAKAHFDEANRYRTEAQSSEAQFVSTAIEGATNEIAAAKRQLRSAYESADYDAVTDAQEKIALASAQLVRLQEAQASLEHQRPRVTGRVEARFQQEPQQQNPVEAFVSQFSPATQMWLRQHAGEVQVGPQGPRLSPKVMAGHYAALSEGIEPDSPEYFARLDQHLSPKPAAPVRHMAEEDEPEERVLSPQRRAPVAAPVSRDPPSNGGQQSSTRTRLTADQAEAARISFPNLSPEAAWARYAKEMKALDRENPSWRKANAR